MFESIYKILSKLLADRIKKVIDKVISLSQSAFVFGRQLLEGGMIANEIVDYATRDNKSCLHFKVDFEKAYDKVSWSFLRYMLFSMGFGDIWLRWTEAMVFSSHMLVMVNGSPTKEFLVEKGLRQGNPLSPSLFVITAEGLINKLVDNENYAGFSINTRCFIDVLQFANDTLMVGDGSLSHLWAIKAVLRGFELISGLSINFNKSKLIGLNIDSRFLEVATTFFARRR